MNKIDKKFIVNLQGKDFVTYEGLLDLAHQNGLKGIETELIQIPSTENNNTCIIRAKAITENGEFHGLGDANPENVNSFISKHLIRMAETRAKARALRDLTNVGMTAIEELGDDKEVEEQSSKSGSSDLASVKQLNYVYKLAKEKNYSSESMSNYIKSMYQKESSKELTKQEASSLIEMLQGLGE